jgi:hypothetical protein
VDAVASAVEWNSSTVVHGSGLRCVVQWDWYAVKPYKSIDRLMCESKNSRVRNEAGWAGTAALPSSFVSAIER